MRTQFLLPVTLLLALLPGLTAAVRAQVMLADDVIIIAKGAKAKEEARTHQHLNAPGGGEGVFGESPGGEGNRLGEPSPIHPIGTLSAAARPPEKRPGFGETMRIQAGPGVVPEKKEVPIFGPLELPAEADEGPPDGLTLDTAIDVLVRENYDLKIKFQEIPKARADIISAGLRNNPIIFLGFDEIPYQNPTPNRTVTTTYGVTVIQPIDWNHKRLYRVDLAQQAHSVLEAQFQEAVRAEIDMLYQTYVDVLRAREVVRAAEAGVRGMEEVEKVTRQLVENKQRPKTDQYKTTIQAEKARVALEEAQSAYVQAKLNLATLLNLPPQEACHLEIRGTLQDRQLLPLCADELIPLALAQRPDLLSYRLGVRRARAGMRLAEAEKYEDIFIFYTPTTYNANAGDPNERDSVTTGVGLLLPLPLINRNQGNIARAKINVAQVQMEVGARERLVVNEVQQAVQRYMTSRGSVIRYEREILSTARQYKDGIQQAYKQGQLPLIEYLNALSEYNDVVRNYIQILADHRMNMLELNTAVGKRILP